MERSREFKQKLVAVVGLLLLGAGCWIFYEHNLAPVRQHFEAQHCAFPNNRC